MATNHLQTVKSILDDADLSTDAVFACSYDEASANPDRHVSMVETGGQAQPYLGVGYVDDITQVTLSVRAPSRAQARADALEVKDALKPTQPADYVQVRRTGSTTYAGIDASGLHVHTIDVICEILE